MTIGTVSLTLPQRCVQNTINANGGSVMAGYAGMATVGVQVSGTWVGTLAFQVSIDGVSWVTIGLLPVGGGALASSSTINGAWAGNVSGAVWFQVIATAWTSGQATVTINPACPGPTMLVIGGIANASTPTAVPSGQPGPIWLSRSGAVTVSIVDEDPGLADGVTSNAARVLDPAGVDRLQAIAGYLYNGASYDRPRTPAVFKTLAAVSVTAGTPVAAWTPTSGKKYRLMGFMLSLSVAGAVILKDGGNSNTELIRTPLMAAGVGLASPKFGNGILGAAASGVLNVDVTASGTVSGFLFGTEE